MKRISFGTDTLQKAAFIILGILAWEGAAQSGIFDQALFPSFSSIAASFNKGITSGMLLSRTGYSLSMILKGLALSFIISLMLSFLAVSFRVMDNIVEVLNSVLHPLPGIALLPIAILWFGISETSIIFIILHSVIWPMVENFKSGFKVIPRTYLEVGRNFGLSGPGLLWGIMVPSALPYIISGSKIGWARAWRAVIAAEMVFGAAAGTAGGLGWHIYMTRYYFDVAGTFAALLAIVIVGILVEELFFKMVERATIKKWGVSL